MGEPAGVPGNHMTGLPAVYVDVPDKSGLPDAGTSKFLNTDLSEAEALLAAEPAPVLYATKAQQRRSNILGVMWILACITVGVLIKVLEDAADSGFSGKAEWTLPVLAVLIPFAIVFSFHPHWKDRQHKKQYKELHKAWLARFIERWPLRERLVDVDSIPDVWQRVSTRTMADTLAADRETILAQGTSGDYPASLLAQALTAVAAWARAPWSDPALYQAAQQAVDRFGEMAGRRRAETEPSAPPSDLS